MDGLMLFEACLSGKLHHVPRRPHDRERAQLIKSGSIFIYEENASGIKRWTDGVAWSPSRILGNFLIYRELEKPFPPGEKKRAMKRKRSSLPGEPYPRPDSNGNDTEEQVTPLTPPTPSVSAEVKPQAPSSDQDKELERTLIGSLVDSYGFRPDGLVKKTMSISVNGISHHMVSYYKVDDVKNQLFPRPLSDARLQNMSVRPELYLKQNFRAPVEETEQYAIDGNMHAHPQMMYPMGGGPYGHSVRPGQYSFGGQQYPMYGMPTSTASPYGAATGTSWPTQQPSTSAVAYGNHPAYASQSYGAYYKPPSQSAGGNIKTEDSSATSQSMPYAGQYTPAYPPMQRNSSQSTPSMVGSAYQTPAQQASSTFGSMSARSSYGGGNMASPATNGQPHSAYGNGSTQPYAVRSPAQSYGMQSAHPGAIAQSPSTALKSPEHAAPPSAPAHEMSYRSGSYAVGGAPHTGQNGGDMNGLGISNNSGYPGQGHQVHNYHGYGSSGPPYRPSNEISTIQQGAHYAQ
ncbi:Global transcription regulator sge1 [Vermiconidia calcicola]|uniref:Global transcription regulator sge1 n=1 Tax=Vermiconidia calcicola TaxID=1690605 RepID=A0ACC3MB85_9PEZI|nr:Global transcription regulator sge1 [Vermiconidia calcicola]